MRTDAAIGIVLNEKGSHVLLVKRQDVPVWVLPGGGIDAAETAEQAVIREVLEETGVKVEIKRKVAEYSPINNLARFTHLFDCRPLNKDLKTGSETKEIAYFSINQLPDNLFFLHKEWLYEALLNKSEVIKRSLNNVTYWNLIKYFIRHPTWVIRFLMTIHK